MVEKVMYLLDTNILLELLLEQDNADEVERFLCDVPPNRLYLSEFSLYSLGIILARRKGLAAFWQMIEDLILQGGIQRVRLEVAEMQNLVHAAQNFNLDFDDAYQYVAAERHNLVIVSFDGDFDRTPRGRQTPGEILRKLEREALEDTSDSLA
jgi:predicted nucleic acid-binding protein